MEQINASRMHDCLTSADTGLKRALERSPRMRLLALAGANLLGFSIMLAAPLAVALAVATSLYLGTHSDGPLDWFFAVCLAGLAGAAAWVSMHLWRVRPRAPEGVPLAETDAPELFAMLDRRVSHFGSRPVASVKLTTEAELHLHWTPTRAIPALHRRTLCVGAPLQYFITQKQFRLALAGAVAASAAMQKSLRGRLALAGHDWQLIATALESLPDPLRALFVNAAQWLSDINRTLNGELLAEYRQLQGRWMMDNSNEQTTAGYLAGKVVAATYLEHQYWPMVLKAAERCDMPVIKPFSHFGLLLDKTLDHDGAKRWLLSAQASNETAHHGMRDELAALGIEQLDWAGLPPQNAFATVFIDHGVLGELDRHWQRAIADVWTRRHRAYQIDRERFDRLHRSATENRLRGKAAAHYIKLVWRFLQPQQAVQACIAIDAANRTDTVLRLACGRELLGAGFVREACALLQGIAETDGPLSHKAQALLDRHAQALAAQEDVAPDRTLRRA